MRGIKMIAAIALLAIGSVGAAQQISGGSSAPSNMATTDTTQTITGAKTISTISSAVAPLTLANSSNTSLYLSDSFPKIKAANVTFNTGESTGSYFILSAATAEILSGSSAGVNLIASSDGVFKVANRGVTDFGRLQLGGTTSSFPAIKRSGAGIAFRLADDSADAAISASTVKTAGFTVAGLPAAGTAGRRAYVTDATACTFLGALTGGASTFCPVVDNGSAWVGG